LNNQGIKPISNLEKDYNSGVYLFISCDLVNATEYKLRFHKWYETFTKFYEALIKKITDDKKVLCLMQEYGNL
jgi:hypothetical protein